MWSVFFHELRMRPVLPDTSQTSSAIFPVMKFWKETRAIPSQELLWHQSKNSNESQFILDYQFSGLSVILLQTKDFKKSLFLATTNYIYQIQRKQKVKPPVFEQNKRTQFCHCTEKKKTTKDHYGKARLLYRDKRITQYIDNRKRRNLATLFQKAITPLVAFSLNGDVLSPLTFITPSTHSPFWCFTQVREAFAMICSELWTRHTSQLASAIQSLEEANFSCISLPGEN